MKLIVVEGARGAGKSTYVQKLRNSIPCTMVMQLTGIEKSDDEFIYTHQHYCNMLDFIKNDKNIPYNLVMDRFFFSEYVMAKLYKDYDFNISCNKFSKRLVNTGIEIIVVLLTLEDNKELFEERLQRPDKVEYQNLKYKAEASIKEQELYREIIHKFKEDFKDHKNVKVLELSNNHSTDITENINKIIEAVK